MILCLIIGIVLITFVLMFGLNSIEATHDVLIHFLCIITVIIGLILILSYIISRPSALDVYRGKTELQITYQGKQPIDSTVVFK